MSGIEDKVLKNQDLGKGSLGDKVKALGIKTGKVAGKAAATIAVLGHVLPFAYGLANNERDIETSYIAQPGDTYWELANDGGFSYKGDGGEIIIYPTIEEMQRFNEKTYGREQLNYGDQVGFTVSVDPVESGLEHVKATYKTIGNTLSDK